MVSVVGDCCKYCRVKIQVGAVSCRSSGDIVSRCQYNIIRIAGKQGNKCFIVRHTNCTSGIGIVITPCNKVVSVFWHRGNSRHRSIRIHSAARSRAPIAVRTHHIQRIHIGSEIGGHHHAVAVIDNYLTRIGRIAVAPVVEMVSVVRHGLHYRRNTTRGLGQNYRCSHYRVSRRTHQCGIIHINEISEVRPFRLI